MDRGNHGQARNAQGHGHVGRQAIKAKWVLVVKRDTDGVIIMYKARLVARGDMQREGVDYIVPRPSSSRP